MGGTPVALRVPCVSYWSYPSYRVAEEWRLGGRLAIGRGGHEGMGAGGGWPHSPLPGRKALLHRAMVALPLRSLIRISTLIMTGT